MSTIARDLDVEIEEDDAEPQLPGSVQLFLRQAARYPLLTAAEEVALMQRVERGDRAARERMITANLRLVVSIAKKFRHHDMPLLDTIQDGMLGLIRAVDKFDWRLGYKFSTYATWWIRQSIQRGIADRGRTIRIPVHLLDRERQVMRVRDELTRTLGRTPTRAELAEEASLTPAELRAVEQAPRANVSLSAPLGEPGDGDIGELIAVAVATPSDELDALLGRDAVWSALAGLSAREREVIRLRFGLGGTVPWTLSEVGHHLGITRERVRQIETHALHRLAASREAALLREAV